LTEPYSILVVGTLDTKGNEIRFLRDRLVAAGLAATVVDIGVLAPPAFPPDVPRDEIARAAGERIAKLAAAEDRGRATAAMHKGLAAWVSGRREKGLREGMIAIGGSAGTAIATAGMHELPIGAPKLMVSTMASGDVRPYVGTSDICMMYSVVDFTGLNTLTSTILANAADAMAGMCGRRASLPEVSTRTLLAATMFGNTTPCVNRVKELLEARGYELLVFHATGTGGQAMERLVVEGFVKGVLDITTTELADELVGGVLTAGPDRLVAAGRKGVPQFRRSRNRTAQFCRPALLSAQPRGNPHAHNTRGEQGTRRDVGPEVKPGEGSCCFTTAASGRLRHRSCGQGVL